MPKNTGGNSRRIECGPFLEARMAGGSFGKPRGLWQRFRDWLFRETY